MTLEDFRKAPQKSEQNHPSYQASIFAATAPEYATGEVLLGSIYRNLLLNEPESTIDLDKLPSLAGKFPKDVGGEELWNILLKQGAIGSPPPKRSPRQQLMPLVPEIARHACVLGGMRSRWNPSNLLYETIGSGLGPRDGETLLQELGGALEVGIDDDIFARFIEDSFKKIGGKPTFSPPYKTVRLDGRKQSYVSGFRGKTGEVYNPAERFCRDLGVIISQKKLLTRRQWTVLLEATVRIGLGMHLLWICQVNAITWSWLLSIADGNLPPTENEIENCLWQAHRETSPLLQLGGPAMPLIEQIIRKYAEARFGINLVLHRLEDAGKGWTRVIGYSTEDGLPAPVMVWRFLDHVYRNRGALDSDPATWLRQTCQELLEEHSDLIKLDSGFSKNMKEFARHSLGQIDARDLEQKSYDQAYLFRNKNAAAKRETLQIVVPGPAMLIAMVNACCHDKAKHLASLEDLRIHFADYGLYAPAGELAGGQAGKDLQKLGLVVDSPDAAGGRLLVPPFDHITRS